MKVLTMEFNTIERECGECNFTVRIPIEKNAYPQAKMMAMQLVMKELQKHKVESNHLIHL